MLEAFGAGTAVIVSPVNSIGIGSERYSVPIDPKKKAGELALKVFDGLLNIQEGRTPHPWSKKIN